MLNQRKNQPCFLPFVGRSSRALNAGVRVSELNPLSRVAVAMVSANCLYSSPDMPPIMVVGMNTASITRTTPMMGLVISSMAFSVASRGGNPSSSIIRVAFSTTTMASSTTMAMASIRPKSVRVFIENPNSCITANVPINDTGIVRHGMSVALQFCKKRNITSTTSMVVSRKVYSTSSIELRTTSVVSRAIWYSTPGGNASASSVILSLTAFETASELEPGDWYTASAAVGIPLRRDDDA